MANVRFRRMVGIGGAYATDHFGRGRDGRQLAMAGRSSAEAVLPQKGKCARSRLLSGRMTGSHGERVIPTQYNHS